MGTASMETASSASSEVADVGKYSSPNRGVNSLQSQQKEELTQSWL
jgi:hypothetical protein